MRIYTTYSPVAEFVYIFCKLSGMWKNPVHSTKGKNRFRQSENTGKKLSFSLWRRIGYRVIVYPFFYCLMKWVK